MSYFSYLTAGSVQGELCSAKQSLSLFWVCFWGSVFIGLDFQSNNYCLPHLNLTSGSFSPLFMQKLVEDQINSDLNYIKPTPGLLLEAGVQIPTPIPSE